MTHDPVPSGRQAVTPRTAVVVGAGAVGSFLGATLATAGWDVTLLGRRGEMGRAPAALTIAGPGDQRVTSSVHRSGDPASAPTDPDLVVLAVKMPDLRAALETAARWPRAPLATVQNGVGAEAQAAAVRTSALVALSLTTPVELSGDGVVRRRTGGIGIAPVQGDTAALRRELAESLADSGLPVAPCPDAAAMKWSKLLANLVGNATSALLDMDPGSVWRDPAGFELERRQLREALAAMRAQGLRVVPDESVTRNSIIAGVTAGRLVVRTEDGSAYDATGAVVGTPTQRERRNAIALPPGFPLTDGTLIALAGEAITREWLEETAKPEPPDGPPPPPPPPPPLNKTSKWEQAHEWAEAGRALRRLTFSTGTASSAMTLSTLAQPFGANTLKVTVGCQGTGKNNSGSFKLLIEDVLITHPTNPLGMAMTIYNSLDEASRTFTARVLLDFSTAGRTGLADTLDKARQAAAADVTIEAEFVPATTPQEKLL